VSVYTALIRLFLLLMIVLLMPTLIFFFFQAEDGIRDFHVTGVQTCALPICSTRLWRGTEALAVWRLAMDMSHGVGGGKRRAVSRSEERRVGKECRSRWLQGQ